MPPPDTAARRAALLAQFGDLKIDAFLVSALPNVRYLSGFTGSNAALLLSPGSAVLYTDPRYGLQSRQETDVNVRVRKGHLFPALLKDALRKGHRRVGFEKGRLSYLAYSQLVEALSLGAELVPVGPVVEELRMVKSTAEVELIRRSVKTNSDALERGLRRFKSGMAEADLAAEIELQMRRLGAEKPSFETIVASGARSALPHARPTTKPIVDNGLLLIDMGTMREGYASDMTRMAHVGSARRKARDLHRAVLEAQQAAVAHVRHGVSAASVDRVARLVLAGHGLDRLFTHSTGHGLGLEIHESPRLGRKDKTRLASGMVVTIEPGVYQDGEGGVRIEDTVLVTPRGCEVLTPTPKELRIL